MTTDNVNYAGFWVRVGAALIDSILMVVVLLPLLVLVYGWGYFERAAAGVSGSFDWVFTGVLPAVAVIVFWLKLQATPGKMLLSAKVVDARTGGTLSPGQAIGRYLAYIVSTIPLGLGFLWIAFDSRKQGWHDKLAGTLVVRSSGSGAGPLQPDPS
jgi:uncharacterized RDD family membrane protein YckC